ncbi:Hsp20/alpha crystallin family protein [Oceanithermus sp.]
MALIKREIRPTGEITPFRSWGPLGIFDEFNRLFEETLGDFGRVAPTSTQVAPVDLYETDEALVLEMAVPGLSADEIDISLEGNKLTIRGENKPVEDQGVRRYYLQEIPHGTFVRSFTLPVEINADEVKAEFKNGVLRLTMPKVETARAKRIPISTEE